MARVSLATTNFVDRGLIQKALVEVKDAKFCLYDYNGTTEDQTSLFLSLKKLDDPASEPVAQYWSVGGGTSKFVPDPNSAGMFLESVGDDQALSRGSNYHLLVHSMELAGMPPTYLEAKGAASFVGIVMEIEAKPVKRDFKDRDPKEKEKTCLVCNRFEVLPGTDIGKGKKGGGKTQTQAPVGQAGSQAGAGTGAAGANGSAGEASVEDCLAMLQEYVLGTIGEDGVPKATVQQATAHLLGKWQVPPAVKGKMVGPTVKDPALLATINLALSESGKGYVIV